MAGTGDSNVAPVRAHTPAAPPSSPRALASEAKALNCSCTPLTSPAPPNTPYPSVMHMLDPPTALIAPKMLLKLAADKVKTALGGGARAEQGAAA